MARYIDADALIEVLRGWREDSAMYDGSGNPVDSILYDVICWIEDTPTADVVPRTELEQLQEAHADLNESLRLACEANKDLQVGLHAMRGAANSYKMHYERLAKEIFAEIREKGSFSDPCVLHIVLSFEELAEIEKKYMEGKE